MNNVATNIDSKSEMYGVKYINCSPEIPIQPPKKDSNFINNINFFFIFLLLSLFLSYEFSSLDSSKYNLLPQAKKRN